MSDIDISCDGIGYKWIYGFLATAHDIQPTAQAIICSCQRACAGTGPLHVCLGTTATATKELERLSKVDCINFT